VLAEEALRTAEANYRTIFEHAPIGIFQSTSEGHFQSVNPDMAHIYGYDSPQDMIAGITDISQQIYVNPHERQEFMRLMAEHGEVIEFVGENFCRDGRIIWTQTTARVVKDTLGNVLYYEGFISDITTRVQGEKDLHEREEQYRTLVEQLPAIVFIDDANNEGRTLYISPQIEKILGFTPQEWQEESPSLWSKQVHPDDLERVNAAYLRCFLYGEPFNEEYRISASDGRLLWVNDQAVLLRVENGEKRLIHGVTYDITERKLAEEAIQTTNILLEQTLEQSPIPTVLVSMPDGIIRSANSLQTFFGHRR
jgi:PAS domain S-box-containing protein